MSLSSFELCLEVIELAARRDLGVSVTRPMVWHPSSRTAVTGKTILFAVSSVTLISIQFHATKTTFEAKSGRSDQITKSGPDSGDRTQRGAWIANSDLATQRVFILF